MKRIHAIELEDLPWVPRALRDGGTDLLDVLFARTHFYRAVAPQLRAVIDATGADTVFDLCSGGGGGVLAMRDELDPTVRDALHFVLTDLYPNHAARERVRSLRSPRVRYSSERVDALAPPPPGARAVRTMFGALHHFQPDQVRAMLQRTLDDNVPIAVFDVAASPLLRALPTALVPFAALPNLAVLFGLSLALVPFARPFRASRVVWSYAVPLIPALFAWDGTVSALRAYEPRELLEITRSLRGAHRFVWSSDRVGTALYLTGRPA